MLGVSPTLAAIAISCCAMPAVAQSSSREATDVYIRRLAGLPAQSAKGEIRIIDVGHDPMSTMLSIVGNRTDRGWVVSYACARSPRCAPGADHSAKTYVLSPFASRQLDEMIATLREDREPEGQQPSPRAVGGSLSILIDFHGFQREYRRTIVWGKTLGRLEALMIAPANAAK